jgi:hypothetical protein
VKIASSGTSAWAAEVLDMKTHSGAEVVDLPGIRVTAVLEKRKGTWLLAHLHCSIPAAGQAIKY